MKFQIYNIEKHNESTVLMYGKRMEGTNNRIEAIKITNIVSPVYFQAVSVGPADDEDPNGRLLDELKKFTGKIKAHELVRRTNIFFSSHDRELELLRLTFESKVSFEKFESDYCGLVLSEFNNPVEQAIISRGLRGPCIVEIENVEEREKSRPTAPIENVKFLSLGAIEKPNAAAVTFELKNNQVTGMVYFTGKNFHRRALRKSNAEVVLGPACAETTLGKIGHINGRHAPEGAEYRTDKICASSKQIIEEIRELIGLENTDILVFHNCHFINRLCVSDRIVCDMYEFASSNMKGKEFSIQEIADFCAIDRKFGLFGDAEVLYSAFYAMNAFELAKEMAEISGYQLNKSLGNARSERIEYTLLHELYAQSYLFPPTKAKEPQKYEGGLVLDPVQGVHDNLVLLLDFNSLYPSIIQEFDVCFSTIGLGGANKCSFEPETKSAGTEHIEAAPAEAKPAGASQPTETRPAEAAQHAHQTFLPKIVTELIERRREIKRLLRNPKDEEERKSLDIRQKALKLTANSIYGCLGATLSRFCNYEMAAYITTKGRELLSFARETAILQGWQVIYGDTDSIMVKGECPGESKYYQPMLDKAQVLVQTINSRYRHVEIEIEKAFKKLILYKKKKYACRVFNEKDSWIECRGLDLVRRNFCKLTGDLLQKCLAIIMEDREAAGENREGGRPGEDGTIASRIAESERIYRLCSEFSDNLEGLPVEYFTLYSQLSKDPGQYKMDTVPPHVHLALRLQEEHRIVYKQGDIIPYIIGKGEGSISERAFLPDGDVPLDYNHYIRNQILPPLFRLLSYTDDISKEKISRIFRIVDLKPSPAVNTLTFILPCCGNVQAPERRCFKCGKDVPSLFYAHKVYSLLVAGAVKTNEVVGKCGACGLEYKNHLLACAYCNGHLAVQTKNKEFDNLLKSLEEAFSRCRIPEVEELLKSYSNASGYRRIDLSRYYRREIEAYDMKYL